MNVYLHVTIHPDFDPVTFDNDLALLKLREPVKLAANIVPVCLAPQRNYVGTYGTVSGWGVTEDGASLMTEYIQISSINTAHTF